MQPRGDRPLVISFRLESLFGWLAILIFCFTPVYFWLQMNPLSDINSFSSVMLNLGRVMGLMCLSNN
jgi:hypothetical protein